jgi:hypothetical protein
MEFRYSGALIFMIKLLLSAIMSFCFGIIPLNYNVPSIYSSRFIILSFDKSPPAQIKKNSNRKTTQIKILLLDKCLCCNFTAVVI